MSRWGACTRFRDAFRCLLLSRSASFTRPPPTPDLVRTLPCSTRRSNILCPLCAAPEGVTLYVPSMQHHQSRRSPPTTRTPILTTGGRQSLRLPGHQVPYSRCAYELQALVRTHPARGGGGGGGACKEDRANLSCLLAGRAFTFSPVLGRHLTTIAHKSYAPRLFVP